MPVWLNEGLAEYFGESIFTGDGFVTGVIPPWRLARLKKEITGGETKSVRRIMNLSPQQWAGEMNIKNYDQVWSMVHFLVHGDDQKYLDPFSDCIREISKGRQFVQVWDHTIGPTDGFEDRWKTWWAGPAGKSHASPVRKGGGGNDDQLRRPRVCRQADLHRFRSVSRRRGWRHLENQSRRLAAPVADCHRVSNLQLRHPPGNSTPRPTSSQPFK